MFSRSLLTLVVYACAALPAQAQGWNVKQPEAAFRFHGKAISPLCLQWLESRKPLDLKSCGTGEDAYQRKLPMERKPHGYSQDDGPRAGDLNRGFNGYGWAEYAVMAAKGGKYLVQLDYSGGGSGIFSHLVLMARKGDVLTATTIQSGDRCVQGLADATVGMDGILHYALYATPHEMMAQSQKTSSNDLHYAALDCVARLRMDYDLNTGVKRLTAVELTGLTVPGTGGGGPQMQLDEGPSVSWDGKPTSDGCFNKLYNIRTRANHLVLTPAELEVLADDYQRNCQ